MNEFIQEMNAWGTAWQYAALFILAAAPWLEVFLVVPLGIGLGLNPWNVALTGFIGNWIPLLLIGLFFKQFQEWRKRRRARKTGNETPAPETEKRSRKRERARVLWERYGVPGLAIIGPTLVGTDIAAVLALSFGSSPRWVMIWITISLALWTILLTFASIYGFKLIGWH